jgi:hypothetical protein
LLLYCCYCCYTVVTLLSHCCYSSNTTDAVLCEMAKETEVIYTITVNVEHHDRYSWIPQQSSARWPERREVVTLLLHCLLNCLLHCSYTGVILLVHFPHTVVTLLSHCSHTFVTLLSPTLPYRVPGCSGADLKALCSEVVTLLLHSFSHCFYTVVELL